MLCMCVYLPKACLLQRPDIISEETANKLILAPKFANLDPKNLAVEATRHRSTSVGYRLFTKLNAKLNLDKVRSLQQNT